MAEEAVKFLRVDNVTTSVGALTNILRFREEYIMTMTPQFVPNTFQGVDMKQDHKWRRLTIVVDSETNIFDGGISVTAANSAFATTFSVQFTLADGAGTTRTWTYQPTKTYVIARPSGEISADVDRDVITYEILTYGTRTVT